VVLADNLLVYWSPPDGALRVVAAATPPRWLPVDRRATRDEVCSLYIDGETVLMNLATPGIWRPAGVMRVNLDSGEAGLLPAVLEVQTWPSLGVRASLLANGQIEVLEGRDTSRIAPGTPVADWAYAPLDRVLCVWDGAAARWYDAAGALVRKRRYPTADVVPDRDGAAIWVVTPSLTGLAEFGVPAGSRGHRLGGHIGGGKGVRDPIGRLSPGMLQLLELATQRQETPAS
jgi:hypothetical protein